VDSVRIHFYIEDKAPSNILEAAIDVFSLIDTTGGVGINEVAGKLDLVLIPNPNNGKFSLNNYLAKSKYDWITVYNALGVKVYEDHYELNTEVDLSLLPFGTYIVKLSSETKYFKFIKH
jgi:hypothetical protein